MYFEGWWSDRDAIVESFHAEKDALKGAKIFVASYDEDSGFDGHAVVLFEKEDKLYLNVGSHCSCNGLEDQWSPGETDWPTVVHFLNQEPFGDFRKCSDEAKAYLRRVAVRRINKAKREVAKAVLELRAKRA